MTLDPEAAMLDLGGRETAPVQEEDDMRRWMVMWTAGAALLAIAGAAGASHDRLLDRAGLAAEASENSALRRYIKHNGMPDVAEVRGLMDQRPWEDHEVSIYYLDARKEICFARARILGRPSIQIERFERTLTDTDVAALRAHAGMLAGSSIGCTGGAAERAECAASRAEAAAERVETAAVRTERAADRTEAIVEKMGTQRRTRAH